MIPLLAGSPILPWRLPSPDGEIDDESYAGTIREIYAYSELRRSPNEIRLARAKKLDRMRTFLGLIGSPQTQFRTVLVAGTKGKGSTAACLTSILEAAGYRVGRYTQPHLYSFRERIWARGDYISAHEVIARFDEMGPALRVLTEHPSELGHLTSFDVGTALALLHFARAGVEVAVVEVGVGGANDATNALEPVLSLVGPVGLDHQATLGITIAEIAREKAGVARRGIDVLLGRQVPEAQSAIEAAVGGIGGRVLRLGADFGWELTGDCLPSKTPLLFPPLQVGREQTLASFSAWGSGGTTEGLRTPLAGPCQRDNAAMAVEAARILAFERPLAVGSIRDGLAQVHWPGRFQRVLDEPPTIVDGAHNAAAAAALVATFEECLPGRRVTLVLGMSAEKDAAAFLDELAPLTDRVLVTRARHPRSADPEGLAALVRERGIPATVAPCPADALRLAWDSTPANGVALVTGSLFLVGDILELLLHADRGSAPCL